MQIVILAAGKGSRMKSQTPKLLHELGDKTLIEHVIDNCKNVSNNIILVYSDMIEDFLNSKNYELKLIKQKTQLGTGHALYICLNDINIYDHVVVVLGDNPFITNDIINDSLNYLIETSSSVVTLAFNYNEPNQYGRVITDSDGKFLKIVEAKYADENELKISLCNSGILVFAPGILHKYLEKCLERDNDGEYFLTSIIEHCYDAGEKVSYYLVSQPEKLIGVNTQDELRYAGKILQKL